MADEVFVMDCYSTDDTLEVANELGARVLHQMHTGWFDPLPVLHDRRFPQFNRMLLARDFLPSTSPHPHMENVG